MDIKITNGVSFGARYTVQSSDIAVDAVSAVAEIIELTITDGAIADGVVNVVLRGAEPVPISVLISDDTPTEVATQIALGTFTGWTVTSDGAVVTFVADDEEKKDGINSIVSGDTGVDGTFEITTEGVDAENAIPGEITFVFKGVGNLPVGYNLASGIQIVDSSNINQDLSDAKISLPANGKIKIQDGSTFKLVAGQKISIVAQRAN